MSSPAARRDGPHGLDAALRVLRDDPLAGVERVAAACGVRVRPLARQCRQRADLRPKAFARLSPFDRAFHSRQQRPDLGWLSIAMACGYYDDQHMTRDFRQFIGCSPHGLPATPAASPEALLRVRHEFDLSYSVPIV